MVRCKFYQYLLLTEEELIELTSYLMLAYKGAITEAEAMNMPLDIVTKRMNIANKIAEEINKE